MTRANNITFLRLLLAMLVVLSHAFELVYAGRGRELLTRAFHTLSFGELAVDMFFLLSGYLIIQSWQRRPNPLRFLQHRVLRIYPAFIAASLFSVFVVGPIGSDGAYFHSFHFKDFARNVLLLQQPDSEHTLVTLFSQHLNGPMWTIAPEAICYMAVMVLGVLSLRWLTPVWLTLTFCITYLDLHPKRAAWWGAIPFIEHYFEQPIVFLHFVFFFCIGGCFGLLQKRIRYHAYAALPCLGVAVLCMPYPLLVNPALAIFGGYFFFWLAFLPTPLSRLDAWGDISYGTYLYAWPIQKLLLWYGVSSSPWVNFFLCAILSMVAGTLSWRLVERRFLRMRAR
jgi:peptidoglycan/LPS O-acetylase OafA/YrhL